MMLEKRYERALMKLDVEVRERSFFFYARASLLAANHQPTPPIQIIDLNE